MSNRLLLVEWAAADWKILHPLIDAGEMPALARLVEGGASGQLLCPQPPVPAMQLTSLVTGKRAWQHGVCHSVEWSAAQNRPVPISDRSNKAMTLWEMLAQEGRKSLVVGWPATQSPMVGAGSSQAISDGGARLLPSRVYTPGNGSAGASPHQSASNAVIVSDRYSEPTAGPGVRPWPPAIPGTYSSNLGGQLDRLRVSPEDIQSDIIALYVPEWRKIDQKRDRRIGQLRIFLAADFSHQKAMVELMEKQEWDFAALRLPALSAITKVFSAPGSSVESQAYQGVIPAACRMLDKMLQQLVALAGPETAVVMVSGSPSYGIFAASGPGFAKDSLVHGAGALDVTPTILSWFGLPLGEDMEGRVLVESLTSGREPSRIPSWEPVGGGPGLPGGARLLPSRPRDAERLAEPLPPPNSPKASLLRDSDWNLAQSCLEAARFEEAQPILERLFREFPERTEVGGALVRCQMALGKLAEAESTLEVVLEGIPPGIASLVPRAELAWEKRDVREARKLVEEALSLNSSNFAALRRIGLLLLKLRDWESLEQLALRALAMDENDPLAWLGLSAAQLRKGKSKEAVESATRAIGLQYFLPDAHFILARALVAQGKWPEAREAMQALLQIQPNNRSASSYFKRLPRQDA